MRIQYNIRDLLEVTLWTALGFGAVLAKSTVKFPIAPAYDEIAETLPWILPMLAGAAFGAALGKLLRWQITLSIVGVFAAFFLTLYLYIGAKAPSP